MGDPVEKPSLGEEGNDRLHNVEEGLTGNQETSVSLRKKKLKRRLKGRTCTGAVEGLGAIAVQSLQAVEADRSAQASGRLDNRSEKVIPSARSQTSRGSIL